LQQTALIAAKTKTNGARVRRGLERKRFEIDATLSESLAQIEDENVNDLVSSHGLNAESVGDWIGTTHGQTLEVYNVPVGPGIEDRVISPQVSMPEVDSGVVPSAPVLAPYAFPFTNSAIPSTVRTNVVPFCPIVLSSQCDVSMVVTNSTPQLLLDQSSTTPQLTDAIVDLPVPITNVTQRQKGLPAVSNIFSGLHTLVSSAASAVSNRFSAPREGITSGLNARFSSTAANAGINPVTTHNQLHCVSEEILISPEDTNTHAPPLRSRICPVTENVRLNDANFIRGGGSECRVPLPLNPEARCMNSVATGYHSFQTCMRNNVSYSSAFARVPQNILSNNLLDIPTSRNIPSQCTIPVLQNMFTDTVSSIPFGNSSERRSNMPANTRNTSIFPTGCSEMMNSNYVTSATAMLPLGTSYEIPPTQPRVCCTTSIANCSNTWSSGPSVQAAENGIDSSYGNQATMQSRVGTVEDQQRSQAGQMNQTIQVFGSATTSSNLDNGLSGTNHLIVPADNVISLHLSQTSGSMIIVPRASSPTLSCHAQCSNVGSQRPSSWQAVKSVKGVR
jgi:hypothetical protein